jgi:hypothetical protein
VSAPSVAVLAPSPTMRMVCLDFRPSPCSPGSAAGIPTHRIAALEAELAKEKSAKQALEAILSQARNKVDRIEAERQQLQA